MLQDLLAPFFRLGSDHDLIKLGQAGHNLPLAPFRMAALQYQYSLFEQQPWCLNTPSPSPFDGSPSPPTSFPLGGQTYTILSTCILKPCIKF